MHSPWDPMHAMQCYIIEGLCYLTVAFCIVIVKRSTLTKTWKTCFPVFCQLFVFHAVPIVSHFKLIPYAEFPSWFEVPHGNQEKNSLPILIFSPLLLSPLSLFLFSFSLIFLVPSYFSSLVYLVWTFLTK